MDTTDDAGGTDRGAHRRVLIAAVIGIVVIAAVVIAGVAATSGGPARVRANGAATPPPVPSTAAVHAATTSTRAVSSTIPIKTGATVAPVTTAPVQVRAEQPKATVPTATPTTAPLRTSPMSALVWTVPSTLTMKAGTTKTVVVSAHNPTIGVVTLPHPLTCAPRLQHDEFCSEVVQRIAPGGTAAASYAISAAGVAPGSYTLRIEGAVTIKVTVTK